MRDIEAAMDIEWSESEQVFCGEVKAFLARHLSAELRDAGRRMTSVYADHAAALEWQKILAARGWAAPAWPVEHGGCDWTVAQHYIFARELARADAPPLSPMGIRMCAPALLTFGTDEQKQFFLPRMLTGEHLWCQGYSEPGAGSDLASLQMSAVEDGDSLVCNGTKIWTTHAQVANWIFCLVRTGKAAKPQQGISFLLIEMATPGIAVQPVISLTGEHIQNQIFFVDVRVPKANLIGNLGAGWSIAKHVLEFERGGTPYAPMLQARWEEIRRFAATVPGTTTARLLDDALFAAKVAASSVRISALEVYELRAMSRLARGGTPGPAASVMKILGTELQQQLTELALEVAGPYGRAFQPAAARPGGPVTLPHSNGPPVGSLDAVLAPLRYLNERAASIYAGSNEIQRNILAKSALGL
jgi:alkylation response protein AidB-like acyl-CoA dehydrogenase